MHFLFILLTFRIILNLYGFDIIPFLSSNDEVAIQDPSIYLNKFGEFKALSFYGQLIDQVYAHHPPIFVWTQTQYFKIFGFNQYTLRIPAILYSIISLSFISFNLNIISEIGLASKKITNLLILVILLEPTYLSWSRFGRNDCLANLFLSISITLLLLFFKKFIYKNIIKNGDIYKKIFSKDLSYLISSSIFLGLAISTHLQYFLGYFFLIAFLTLLGRFFIPLKDIFVILFIPPFLTLFIWILAFKKNLILSIQVLNDIQENFSGHELIISGLNKIIFANGKFNPQMFFHQGGTLLILNFFAYFLTLIFFLNFIYIFIKNLNSYTPQINKLKNQIQTISNAYIKKQWVYLSVSINIIQITLIIYKYGIGTSRFYSFLPITSLTIPILLNWCLRKYKFKSFRVLLKIILITFIPINLFLMISYFALVNHRMKNDNFNYNIVENYIKKLSPEIKNGIAAPPIFWLAMQKILVDKKIHIIDNGFAIERNLTPKKRLKNISEQTIDLVILSKKSSLVNLLDKSNSGFVRTNKDLNLKGVNYLIYKKLLFQKISGRN